ncbi:MAG TPA: tripartite tricarboxylate transporter substrate binding protein [Burkholderiaceae bacterium]|nr:tripartite tricarboxylate transporter substrate binding protein [Burkholderiaceae bacterium]
MSHESASGAGRRPGDDAASGGPGPAGGEAPGAEPSPSRRRLLIAATFAPLAAPQRLSAQPAFPSRPITLVVPFAAGGIADLTARAVTRAMGESLGQPFVVDNRPSAGAIVAGNQVLQARPDGHTLLLMSNANAVSASLFRKLPFDATRDFQPICTLGFFELALVVAQDSRFRTLADLLADAKARPGKLNIGTISIGSTQHLAAELFKTRAGIDAQLVPYKATPAVLTGLRGGEIDVAFEILGPLLPQLQSRALRALAVTGGERHPSLPDVPTVREAGIGDYDVASWNALAAPAGTPRDVIERLQRAARDAVAQPSVQQNLRQLGVRALVGTPEQLQRLLADEIRRWGGVIRAAKIEPQ